MTRFHQFAAAIFVVAGLLLPATVRAENPTDERVLAAHHDLRWYRGNLHTHSHWSDGNDYLEMIALWYRDHGYDFLCFTDHNVLANSEKWVAVDQTKGGRVAYDKLKARLPDWIDERETDGKLEVRLRTFVEVSDKFAEPEKFLLIQGEEISDRYKTAHIHLNASNVQELLTPRGGESVLEVMQNNVDAVISQRERSGVPIFVHLNHPNYGYGVSAEDLMRVVGENFFEVYNGHPGVHNTGSSVHASTDRIWDIVLTWRLAELEMPLMYGLAVDDGHEYHKLPSRASNPGRGWVYVLTSRLTPESLIAALEAGEFYASSGVRLRRIATGKGAYRVEVEAEPGVDYTIEFLGTRRGFDAQSEEFKNAAGEPVGSTRKYSDEVGAVLQTSTGAEAEYKLTGDELYVRARITSSKPHPNPSEEGDVEQAWCQPMLGPAAPAPAN